MTLSIKQVYKTNLKMDLNKFYCGIIEDINDPDRTGRAKVRIQGIFDETPLEDIPWAGSFHNINSGKQFELPKIGKLVNVVFRGGNIYQPQYISSENYNINLKNKLEELEDEDYEGFTALTFDERTQIFSNDEELTVDYKYNKITISDDDINFELKDNNQKVNIGTKKATQQAMLGNHWMDWFDTFIRAWQNEVGMLGNGIIIIPPLPILKPMVAYKVCVDYWLKRETFLSDHVYITDDRKIKKLE